jgi:hypothetical protein
VTGITVSIPVTCTGAARATCSITALVSIIEKRRGSNLIAVTAARSPRLKSGLVTLGSTRAVINSGQTRTVRLSLNSIGQRLLATRQVVRVKLTVRDSVRAISTSIISFRHSVRKRR